MQSAKTFDIRHGACKEQSVEAFGMELVEREVVKRERDERLRECGSVRGKREMSD